MADTLSHKQRHKCMSRVRNKDTKIELFVRKTLHSAGFRYRLHKKNLPGKPDLVLPKYATVIFINGCFWHGHNCKKAKLPKTNSEFWKNKIEHNQKRDKENSYLLSEQGWNVFTIWECRLQEQTSAILKELAKLRATSKNKKASSKLY